VNPGTIPQDPALEMRGVTFRWPGAGSPVLNRVSLRCEPGEFLGILGPNGVGKSTLLRLACGLLEPEAGEVHAVGLCPSRARRREVARRIALVPAWVVPGFPMTVRELVALGRTPHLRGLFESRQDREAIDRSLVLAEVADLEDRRFQELSAGEQRRVLVARALAQEPRLLLMDEPTANLDVAHSVRLLEGVLALARRSGIGVAAAIHDLNAALLVCDRIALLHQGRIRAFGDPDEVMRWSLLREVFGCDLYIGRNEMNGRLFVAPMGSGREGPGTGGIKGTSC